MQSMEKSWWWVSWRNMPLLFLHSRLSPYTHLGSFNNWKCWSQIEPNFPVVKLKSLHAIPHPVFPPLPMPPRLLRKLYSGPILLSHALLHQIRAYTPFPRAHGGLSAVQLLSLPQPLSPVTHNRLQEAQRQPEIRDLKLISGLSPPSSRKTQWGCSFTLQSSLGGGCNWGSGPWPEKKLAGEKKLIILLSPFNLFLTIYFSYHMFSFFFKKKSYPSRGVPIKNI